MMCFLRPSCAGMTGYKLAFLLLLLQVPGLVVMQLANADAASNGQAAHDSAHKRILVVLNASSEQATFDVPSGMSRQCWVLEPPIDFVSFNLFVITRTSFYLFRIVLENFWEKVLYPVSLLDPIKRGRFSLGKSFPGLYHYWNACSCSYQRLACVCLSQMPVSLPQTTGLCVIETTTC